MKYGIDFSEIDARLAPHYLNPNELQPMQSQMHVCETLFGDWNAKVCIVLQDAADVISLEKYKKETGRPILSHYPDAKTNRFLVQWFKNDSTFSELIDIYGRNSTNCGIYYANAVWFIKRLGGMSGRLPLRSLAIESSQPILKATFEQLSNLELVMTFGEVAYLALKKLLILQPDWSEARNFPGLIKAGRYLVGVCPHPAARGLSESVLSEKVLSILGSWRKEKI